MKQGTRILCIAAALFCMAVVSPAQPHEPTEPMRVQVDFARFRGDDQHTYLEIYYAFSQNSLTYVKEGDEFKAGVELTVVARAKDSIHFADRVMVPHVAKEVGAGGINLISISGLMLRDGEYTLSVVGKDANNPARRDSISSQLSVRKMPEDRLALSDIEFASAIRKAEKGSPFFKNTFEVIPNPGGVYGDEHTCYYYAEAYNLLKGEDRSDMTVKTTVHNAIGKEVISREQPRRRTGESTVLVGSIDVSRLKGGTYTLMLALQDSTKRVVTMTRKKFFVVNSVLGIDSALQQLDPAVMLTVFATLEEPELDAEFKAAQWEALSAEKDQYKMLSGVEAKRKFLTEFWSRRPVGARDAYFARVRHADNAFRVLGREGHRTDRGRVLIMYGHPDDVERHHNESGTKPYEIWSYNSIQGGVSFVFVLRQQGGDYELVHSTHRNELHDDNWARFVQTN
jgi:GWxTD domain-containing protein